MNKAHAFQILLSHTYEQHPVFIFTYENEYPVLFFTALLKRLSECSDITLKNVGATLESRELLDTEIHTTFLGQTRTLWLGCVSNALSASEQSKILALCNAYKGPHRLLLAAASKDVSKSIKTAHLVSIDQDLTMQEQDDLIAFLFPSLTSALIQKISGGIQSFKSIDSFMILAHYAMVVGRNTDAFVCEWLPKIIAPESSLFSLSQYFFAKKSFQFWGAWNLIKHEYPATFWTVYWSEQLWRAYYVIIMQQKGNIVEARKMAYRLPFSFIQKDWKDTSLSEIRDAHTLLYEIEWRIKNGGSEEHFDLLFHKFMLKSSY